MEQRQDPSDPKVERFAQLLARCQRRVFLYLLGLLHNTADAEEALQETNLVLWRKFDEFEPGTHFDRWACRIAYFEAMKFREKKVPERLFSNEFVDALAVQADDQWLSVDDRRQALVRCLEKLSERDRRLITERYQQGGTTRGVASLLGRSLQGARKSLHRIRTALLGCIERTLAAEEHA